MMAEGLMRSNGVRPNLHEFLYGDEPEKRTIPIYLAGKIGHTDWRHRIFELGNTDEDTAHIYYENDPTRDGFRYVGPHFIRCDHGCFHGDESHGRGAVRGGCFQTGDGPKRVKSLCMEWLRQAEVVFAWIDAEDCYGTIAEIGAAQYVGKPVFVAFADKIAGSSEAADRAWDDMWFVRQQSLGSYRCATVEEAWRVFVCFAEYAIWEPDCGISPLSMAKVHPTKTLQGFLDFLLEQDRSIPDPGFAGYVYVIQSPHGYKIGCSKRVTDRIKLFGIKLPFKVETVFHARVSDMRAVEAWLHKTFASRRLEGEWFNLSDCELQRLQAMVTLNLTP